MDVVFADRGLEVMESDPKWGGRFDGAVVQAYRDVMNLIRSARDERDVRAMKSLHFEKLKGKRSHQHSLKLKNQWRLIIEIEKANPKNRFRIVAIEDYH